MLTFRPPTLDAAHRLPLWSLALMIAVLTVPLLIATLALVLALLITPLLSTRHQRIALRLLAGLRQWSMTITDAVRRDTS